ncbi:zinc finger protein 347-like [Oncorhynchus keta]|uniref:zinc finger protein 347-like n=1 Tax=Oncorhynchus keta TaxID=8018 RepID=UPI00227BFB35|nr:zinc finger protein 347-like [Oncorhynchus keta]
MSKLQLLRLFLNERLTAAAVEIFGAVEKTVVEYQEENDRLRRLLRITPEMQLCKIDSLQLSVSEKEVPSEQQHCEQEWSPSLWQEDPDTTLIKGKQEEVRTNQEEEQLQGVEPDIIEFIFTPSCVKSECDQSLTLPQTKTVENRESDSKPVDLKPFGTVTHINGLYIPCLSPYTQNNASSHSSAISSDPVGLDSSPPLGPTTPLDPNMSMGERGSKPSTTSRKTHHCHDYGEMFPLKADLQRHGTLTKKRLSECHLSNKQYNSTCKLEAHVQLCPMEKSCTCPICGMTIKHKGDLSRHMGIHTGEKPFSCGVCGKSFYQKGHLTDHIRTHTGEKPFSCGDCGKSFNLKGNLRKHKLTHTGEKPFSCGDCGRSFSLNMNLTRHKLTHTGEKPFSCGDCGKSFTQKTNLLMHVKNIHKGGKQDKN